MRRLLLVLLVLLAATPVIAATLTPERRAVPMSGISDAAWNQAVCCVATSGDGFVALWYDQRSNHGANGFSAFYATHLSADGNVSPAAGIQLFDATAGSPSIASDGSSYVAAAQLKGGIYTRQLDRDGRPLGDARLVLPSTLLQSGKVASNGHGYVFISFDWNGAMTWMRLDAAGLPASASHPSGLSVPFASPFFLTTSDGTYHAVYADDIGLVHDITIDESDHVAMRTLASIGYSSYSAISMGNRLVLAWAPSSSEVVGLQIFDSADQPIGPTHTLAFPGNFSDELTLAFDGSTLLLAKNLTALRLTRSGDAMDATPFAFTNSVALHVAAGNGRTALVWSAPDTPLGNYDVYARVVGRFDEIVSSPPASTRLSNAPAIQHSPATALLGGRRLTVWRGGDAIGSIEASIDGAPAITIAAEAMAAQDEPAVAVAGDTALVVWRSRGDKSQVLAARLSADGKLLDSSPIVLATSYADGLTVTGDGQTFVAAWPGEHAFVAMRVSTTGALLDSSPIEVADYAPYVKENVYPHAFWTGSLFAFVFMERTGIAVARMTRTGSPIDAFVYNEPRPDRLTAAASGSRVVAAWVGNGAINTMELSADTLVAQPPKTIVFQTAGFSSVSMAARGDAFVVAWSWQAGSQEEVRAAMLDRGDWFVVAPADAYDVAVMPTPSGFTFTYARTDPDAANVAQLFTRDLVIARRRAVR